MRNDVVFCRKEDVWEFFGVVNTGVIKSIL